MVSSWCPSRPAGGVATKLKCLLLRKVELSVRPSVAEAGLVVRRLSDRSTGGSGDPALGGSLPSVPSGRPDPSSGPASEPNGAAQPAPPMEWVECPDAL